MAEGSWYIAAYEHFLNKFHGEINFPDFCSRRGWLRMRLDALATLFKMMKKRALFLSS